MSDQLQLFGAPFTATDIARLHERGIRLKTRPYVIQGQERPADLKALAKAAATVEARVLAWFQGRIPQTPSQCAEAMSLKVTSVRPRICVLAGRTSGPRLVHVASKARLATVDGGSEGFYRYEGGEK